MHYRFLADLVLIIHVCFVAFVMLGGFAVLRWPRIAWLHVPAALWGFTVEATGWFCPLTDLENFLRRSAGSEGYSGGCIEHYALGMLYPDGLTREIQWLLAGLVVVVNGSIYGWLCYRRLRSDSKFNP